MAWTEEELREAMASLVTPDQVLAGSAVRRAYDCDAYSIDRSSPSIVVMPTNTAEVAVIIRWCNNHGVPFTPRGAGTGLSGGAMPALGGVVVSTKRLNQILEIDPPNRRMRAQAGTPNLKLSQAVAAGGFHFAPDPSSQAVSTLGGNIAENSGGPHTLKYGVTTQHILSVTLVDETGTIHEIGSDVPGGPGYDTLSLIIGSEGTLGLVTEAWVRLTPNPEEIRTLLASFRTTRDATETVAHVLADGIVPAALEMLDRQILVAVDAAFGFPFPSETEAMLLIECDGAPEIADAEIKRVAEICRTHGALKISIAEDLTQRAELWKARKKGIGAMGRLAPTIVTHDGVIPPSRLPEMLDEVYRIATELGLGVANMFHAGDGNLHPIFYFDERQPGKVEAVVEAGDRVIEKCLELGGSVSGEHGIGVEKIDLLAKMFDPDSMALQVALRNAFSSSSLCNPCKVIPHGKGCVEHMRRWRGAAS